MKVLVIDPDALTRRSTELTLAAHGITVETTDSGLDALQLVDGFLYDLVVLGDDTADASTSETFLRLLGRSKCPPMLIITDDEDRDRMCRYLDGGADDYLIKPLSRKELVSRARAVVRRSQGRSGETIRHGNLRVELDDGTVFVDDRLVHLTGSEFKLLGAISRHPGKTVTRDRLHLTLYDNPDRAGDPKIIDVLICKIRKKLRVAGCDQAIVTDWGRGYILQTTDSTAAAA